MIRADIIDATTKKTITKDQLLLCMPLQGQKMFLYRDAPPGEVEPRPYAVCTIVSVAHKVNTDYSRGIHTLAVIVKGHRELDHGI